MAFAPVYAAVGDNKYDIFGSTPCAVFDIQFSGTDTYVTGGLALTAATFGLSRPILSVEPMGSNTAATVWSWFWNVTTQKFMMLGAGGGAAGTAASADASNGTAMTNFSVRVIVTCQR